MQQESYKQSSMPPRLQPANGRNIADCPVRKETGAITTSEISNGMETLAALQSDLLERLESLWIKLAPVMREPCPQESCGDKNVSVPQTPLGREIYDNCARLESSIRSLKDITDRICL